MLTNSNGSPEVLVVGAGPVGLTMACELARHGVRCRIVDSSDGPTTQSRALGIQARTLEVFEDMGIVDEVLSLARKIHGVTAFDDVTRITHITFDMEALETHYPYLLILPQGTTERILVDRLKTYGIEVERRTTLRGIAPDATGVNATLADFEGQTSTVRTSWLIGCDGSRSVVRKALELPFDGADYEESFLLADVRLEWNRPADEMTILLTPVGPVVAFPFAEEGRWRLVHASTEEVAPADAEPVRVVEIFQGLLRQHGRAEAAVSDPGWTSAFKIHRRVAGRFREGRCFIAGDAAHIHSPAGGQGMNTGIQDAYNLAWKLALVIRGESPDSLLDSYSVERRAVVAGVVKGSDLLTRVVTLRNTIAKSFRDHLAGILGEFDFVARKLSKSVSELGIEYHGSPIIEEDRSGIFKAGLADSFEFRGGLHPGERVPDILLEPPDDTDGPTRLYEILQGTKHILLVFEGEHCGGGGQPVGQLLQVAKGRESQIQTYFVVHGDVAPPSIPWDGPVIRDHLGAFHRRMGAGGACVYLIRPDGYLGYRSMPPDPAKLTTYLSRIFVG